MNDSAADHVLLTRFNLPTQGVESLVRAHDGWLTERVALFERYTVPSVLGQTTKSYHWIVYFDPQSPDWLLTRMHPYVESGVFRAIFRTTVTPADVVSDLRDIVDTPGSSLITTNLDNDDGLATDFLMRVREHDAEGPSVAIYLTQGLILSQSGTYLHEDRRNAFCSVRESWDDPRTCWYDWHNLLGQHMPAIAVDGPPAWLQVIHGGNVSNRVRGRRVRPSAYRHLFGQLLVGEPEPRRGDLIRDRLIGLPYRTGRDAARGVLKSLVLRAGGKAGLDSVKSALAPAKKILLRQGRR